MLLYVRMDFGLPLISSCWRKWLGSVVWEFGMYYNVFCGSHWLIQCLKPVHFTAMCISYIYKDFHLAKSD